MASNKVTGNTKGLKASALRAAERIFRRRIRPNDAVTPEFATFLCEVSHEMGRQVGVLVDRRGQPDHVFVGDANRLWLPDIGRLRAGRGRLRGLRLIHTHLRDEPLTNDDLTDLALLRLDLVMAITMTADGLPKDAHVAHLLPENSDEEMWRVLPRQPLHQVALDPLELTRSLEEEFARASAAREAGGANAALLIHVALRGERAPEVSLAELTELCATAGVSVFDRVIQPRQSPDPRYVIGRGKLEEVLLRANQLGAEMLIFDCDLSAAQARAISDATELKVIDRTMLILDIFAQRARSRDGKLQVELAQLRYTLPRLVAKNTMMSRLTGGIGGRGPGETKLEINRRRARDRIARLTRELEQVGERRTRRRSLRTRRGLPVVSLIGYTNAGKSTLLNTLTQSKTLVEDKLFATLDPASRRLRFPRERELILTDTVGFIHDLPSELVEAFRATLEELDEADLLLHVVDISDPSYEAHIAAVRRIVADLGLAETPTLLVFNKIDRLDADELERRTKGLGGIPLCALEQQSARPLMGAMEEALWRGGHDVQLLASS
ncbi:MAG: GTPase HflX [Myxococcales bacterium]|nr:GTPase HflX [Myxococcales bacterium]